MGNIELNKNNWKGWILFICFITLMFILFVQILRTAGLRLTAFLIPFILITWNFIADHGFFFNRLKGKGFWFATGVPATIRGNKIEMSNDRIGYFISVFNGYITNPEVKKRYRAGGFYSFLDLTTHYTTLFITGRSHQFEEIPSDSCEDPSGCVKFYGSINGIEIPREEERLMKKLKNYKHTITMQNTLLANTYYEVSKLAQQKTKDFADVSNKLKSITSNLRDNPLMLELLKRKE